MAIVWVTVFKRPFLSTFLHFNFFFLVFQIDKPALLTLHKNCLNLFQRRPFFVGKNVKWLSWIIKGTAFHSEMMIHLIIQFRLRLTSIAGNFCFTSHHQDASCLLNTTACNSLLWSEFAHLEQQRLFECLDISQLVSGPHTLKICQYNYQVIRGD